MHKYILFGLLIFFSCNKSYSQSDIVNHKLDVTISPTASSIQVMDVITVNRNKSDKVEFKLNSDLKLYYNSKNIKVSKIASAQQANDIGMDMDSYSSLKIDVYSIDFLDNSSTFELRYKGNIDSPIEQSMENYQRGFSESPGIISDMGIYLAGSSYWVPTFNNVLVTFEMNIQLTEKWLTVSQGEYSENGDKEVWNCSDPQEEIFLIAADFTKYDVELENGIHTMAFLRTKDDALANKYLSVTEQYMAMYNEMIGEYPYTKFALVENFWETGYGMPSFTLLGEKIIRFPFILHSSYPHELLHNWWGNSVYVDFDSGNWCEGLTAYLADHLIKEQRNQAVEYRRSTLQKYADYVGENNDFPLSKFHSRHDASSEAIGYGKSLMFFHMLRKKIGDSTFVAGLKDFYIQNKFKNASFDDIRKSMEKVSDKELKSFFDLWVNNIGAPEIKLTNVNFNPIKKQLDLEISQTQKSMFFPLELPVYITTDKGVEMKYVPLDQRVTNYSVQLEGKPLKLDIDPFYDVFRIVDNREVPPALSKILGSKDNVFILPSSADDSRKNIYLEFANQWMKSDNDNFTIAYDNEFNSLPKDKTPWIVGAENKFANIFQKQIDGYSEKINIGQNNDDLIITAFDPDDFNKQLVFVSVQNEKSIPGLVRKLPHYGKYSYLGFQGDEPENNLKGQWNVIGSPMEIEFSSSDNSKELVDKSKALGELKPVYSKSRMMSHIDFLASEDLKGRGLGTKELDKAAKYIADKFSEYGLMPVGGSYYQEFTHSFEGKGFIDMKNVVAMIPGSDSNLKNEPVIVSAHYDHLGTGWPDVHAGDEGKIHYGADDNASWCCSDARTCQDFGF
ncbi:MAG: M1 family aminopeptidase [Saprospiraceae bacterium]